MRADLTQEKMSEMIGVTPQYLSDLERGLVGTSVSTLIRICTELNVSADFILFGRGDEKDGANSTLIEKIQRLPKYKADMVESTVDILLEAMDMEPGKRAGNDR
jgi:transcriptional regulator with XRE-family HTH domain